ncbi:hypothetical protein Tco_0782802 [Tanacetum coccineum]
MLWIDLSGLTIPVCLGLTLVKQTQFHLSHTDVGLDICKGLSMMDSLAAAENEIAILQIRVADIEDRHAEDHEQIQKILACLGL